jgi:O-antigen/teichoic acid export membrane protein
MISVETSTLMDASAKQVHGFRRKGLVTKEKLRVFTNHKGFMKYFRNTSWLFAGRIAGIAIEFFVGIWLLRYLGPEQFGTLNYAMSFVGLFAAVASVGLDGILVRELVKNDIRRDTLVGTVFWLKLIGVCFVLLAVTIAVRFASNQQYINILIFIIVSGTIFQSLNVIDCYFQSAVLSRYVVIADAIRLTVSSTIRIAIILNNGSLIAFAIVVVVDKLVLALGFLYFYLRRDLTLRAWKFDATLAKELLIEASPLIISIVSVAVSEKISSIILKELVDMKSLGLYAASLRIVGSWYFIPIVLTTSLFSAMIASDDKDVQLKTDALGSLLVYLGLGIGLMLILSSGFLIKALCGEAYLYSRVILAIQSLAIVFVFFASLRKKMLLAEGKTRIIMAYSVITALIMAISCYAFISFYGLIGAAIGYLFTWATAVLIVPILFGRFQEDVLGFLNCFNPNRLKLFYTYLRS